MFNNFDFIYSSQVIEHLEDDKKMIKEFSRLLKSKKFFYVSSVIKRPFTIYKYRNNGRFVLDPTHEREYSNEKEFLDLFKEDFKLIKYSLLPVKRSIFGIQVKIPGYWLIEGTWQKRK